jgi:predicted ATPase
MQAVVFTGGPGAGKTTVLHSLRSQGYSVVEDSARAIIRERKRQGLAPRPQPLEFAKEILRVDIDNYQKSAGASGYVFFDRGILDALCMLDQIAPVPLTEPDALVTKYPYDQRVFCFPPWEAIYACDAERDHTFAHAVEVYATTVQWYRRCKYEVVEVPKRPVIERSAYILEVLARGNVSTH